MIIVNNANVTDVALIPVEQNNARNVISDSLEFPFEPVCHKSQCKVGVSNLSTMIFSG